MLYKPNSHAFLINRAWFDNSHGFIFGWIISSSFLSKRLMASFSLLCKPFLVLSFFLGAWLNHGLSSILHWIVKAALLNLHEMHIHFLDLPIILLFALLSLKKMNIASSLRETLSIQLSLVQGYIL